MRATFFFAIFFAAGCAADKPAPEIAMVERISGATRAQADALARDGRHKEAAAAYRALLSTDSSDVAARYGLAEALRSGGEAQAARAEYLAVAEVPEWRVRALEGLGQAALITGDQNGAYEALTAAVAEDAKAWRAWLGLAQLRDLAHDWAKADEAYGAALAAGGDKPVIYNNHGVSMLARGEPGEAAGLFRKALAADSNFDRAATNLELANASSAASLSEIAAAEPDARKRAQKLNNAGYVAMLQGRLDEAERFFDAAIKAHPAFYGIAYENLKVLKAMQAEARKN
ncbi:MAG: tetratricopeptide repeat protein [Amphiplicatus sp.]